MKRREFVAGLGSVTISPLAAHAQQRAGSRRVGVLMNGAATVTEYRSYLAAFTQGLGQRGWVEGRNLRLDVRWNAGDAALARTYAGELNRLLPDVILAASSVNVAALQEIATAVPVVFVSVADPVAQGFVASMREPGGNFTGFSMFEISLGSKWLGLLKQVAPGIERVAVMFNPETAPYSKLFIPAIVAAAQSLGMQVIAMPIKATADIEPALTSFALSPNGGLMTLSDSFVVLRYSVVADLATRYRLASIAPGYNFAKQGGLIEYGPSIGLEEQFRQSASYVDRILNGAKPADLPVQAPTKYRLVVNMTTAKTLGLNVPLPLLGLADEVIE